MNKPLIISLLAISSLVLSCKTPSTTTETMHHNWHALTYIDDNRIAMSQAKIDQGKPVYIQARKQVIQRADEALNHKINPVTNKPKPGPSGDYHDYVSIGPYWWPDSTKANGLPWIRKDGQINPLTRGDNTDQTRAKTFLHDLGYLNTAYLFTRKIQYMHKAREMIFGWFIDPKTRMKPNLNYAQGVPGSSTGRPFGIIEWENISNVITSVELLEKNELADQEFIQQANLWLSEYLTWLLTSEIGVQEGATHNNHANWYDFQVIGLMIHLKQIKQAKAYVETLKHRRIDKQIMPDGSQPHELARTKSVNYSSMNLMAFLKVANLAEKINVDLLRYSGPEGQSIQSAVKYMLPFVKGEKIWKYQQLGGAEQALQKKAIPTLYVAHQLLGDELVPTAWLKQNMHHVSPTTLLTF